MQDVLPAGGVLPSDRAVLRKHTALWAPTYTGLTVRYVTYAVLDGGVSKYGMRVA